MSDDLTFDGSVCPRCGGMTELDQEALPSFRFCPDCGFNVTGGLPVAS